MTIPPRLVLFLSLASVLGAACGSEPLGQRAVEVELAYEETTNWGPTDATGVAAIDTLTGEVIITVQGLPALADDEYEGWLAGGGEEPLSTGKFVTDDGGVGGSTIVLGDLSDTRFERVVITVEPVPDPTPAPDPRHSIGGYIPPAE